MRSIRAKVTTLTVCAVAVALTVAILLGFLVIRSMAETNAERTLRLLCETGQKNLNAYYDSVAQSVEIVSSFVDGDLKSLEEEELRAQVDRTRDIFAKTAKRCCRTCVSPTPPSIWAVPMLKKTSAWRPRREGCVRRLTAS